MKKSEHTDPTRKTDAIRRRLVAYFRLGIGGKYGELFRTWMADDTDRALKDEATEEMIREAYPGQTTADIKTLHSLNEIKRRHGLPITRYKIKNGRVLIPEFQANRPNTGKQTLAPNVKLRRRPVWMKVAAVLVPLLLLGAASVFIIQKAGRTDPPIEWYTSVSANGNPEHILLPDGSRITVKSGSVQYTGDFKTDRRVKISGEAYFSVSRDEAHPFTVDAGGMKVTVLGTEFNIRAIESEATSEVMLARGRVSVDAEGIEKTTVMVPGQTYVYDKTHRSMELTEISRTDLMRMLGKKLQFESETVGNILDSLGDYYGVIMNIDTSLRLDNDLHVKFTGREPLDDILYSLKAATDKFDYYISGDTVHIIPRKQNPEKPGEPKQIYP